MSSENVILEMKSKSDPNQGNIATIISLSDCYFMRHYPFSCLTSPKHCNDQVYSSQLLPSSLINGSKSLNQAPYATFIDLTYNLKAINQRQPYPRHLLQ